MFDFIIREDNSIIIALRHLLLEITNKRLIKKKFYLITLTDLEFKTLTIFDIKATTKLDSITNKIKSKNRFKNKIKTKPKDTT